MTTALLLAILVLLFYVAWQVSRAADGNSLRLRLDQIEEKLDYILLIERADDGADQVTT